jgi:hypothetical protein
MNERIKQLIKAAGGLGHDEDGQELTPMLVGSSLEKFTELIVRECAGLINSMDHSSQYFPHVADAIKEHFGVKE